MTPEMIAKARGNAVTAGAQNVEFRLGDMEQMPVEDSSVDWVISNCVINLAPDKPKVFSEISRVLRPGGRLSISDIVTGQLAEELTETRPLWAHCIGGAMEESEYLGLMSEAGLEDTNVVSRQHFDETAIRGVVASFGDAADRDLVFELLGKYPDTVDKIWSSRITGRKQA
ncbi:MAG: methyltransferase domain-containing protein [Dehalococcoidia bacterium]|nr:methyltransferase domain-containing protein [Dehalococcoidia bacterium]